MTKEELKEEAEKYVDKNNIEWELECHRTSPIGEVIQAYLASAEPREKQIAELTEQNTSLLTSVENLNKSVQEVEKENAELRLKLEALEGQTPWKDIKDKGEVIGKLTKAKEIIEKLRALYLSPVVTKNDVKRQDEILNEAEQFLNSEVEK